MAKLRIFPVIERVALADAHGRVLARDIFADRDYPPFPRSTRDGYAVRAADITQLVEGGSLSCVGEIKAGDAPPAFPSGPACFHIMTGAAIPAGADAVVMLEQTTREGDAVRFPRAPRVGQNIVPRASEGCSGQVVLRAGMRLGYAEIAAAAQVGAAHLECARRPRVGILSTGDEIVDVDAIPGPFQIRNSNAFSLAAQVGSAGGDPVLLGNAADREEALRKKIALGLQEDLLLLSGGVSMGKYDLVEKVLREMGAEFLFDAVAMRPGKPTVFAMCQGKPVLGLPGNPVSTMVSFELFAVPAIDLLGGAPARPLPFVNVTLGADLHEKPGLAHFLPARVEWGESMGDPHLAKSDAKVRPLPWQGSGDIAAMAQANCLLVIAAEVEHLPAGTTVPILLRKDVV